MFFHQRSDEHFQQSRKILLILILLVSLVAAISGGILWYMAAAGKLGEPDYCPPCACFPCWSCGNCPAFSEQLYGQTPQSPYPEKP
jgi:flagellar basal body-associated protein FliL